MNAAARSEQKIDARTSRGLRESTGFGGGGFGPAVAVVGTGKTGGYRGGGGRDGGAGAPPFNTTLGKELSLSWLSVTAGSCIVQEADGSAEVEADVSSTAASGRLVSVVPVVSRVSPELLFSTCCCGPSSGSLRVLFFSASSSSASCSCFESSLLWVSSR